MSEYLELNDVRISFDPVARVARLTSNEGINNWSDYRLKTPGEKSIWFVINDFEKITFDINTPEGIIGARITFSPLFQFRNHLMDLDVDFHDSKLLHLTGRALVQEYSQPAFLVQGYQY